MAFDSATPINRRTVAKGIAWSVPAVAVAGTAPAFAASRPVTVTSPLGRLCRLSGNSCDVALESGFQGLLVALDITNTTGFTITFTFSDAKSDYNSTTQQAMTIINPTVVVGAAGDTVYLKLINTGSSAQDPDLTGSVKYSWSYTAVNGQTVTGNGTVSFGANGNVAPCASSPCEP